MFGKYSSEATKDISTDRTEKTREVIRKNGGKIISMYSYLGRLAQTDRDSFHNFTGSGRGAV
jgi:hypothetical protein